MDTSLLTSINSTWTHPWLDGVMVVLTTVGLALCAGRFVFYVLSRRVSARLLTPRWVGVRARR